MTLNELSQLYYLRREIEREKQRLEQLQGKEDVAELEQIIRAKIARCNDERTNLEKYIADIPDSLTRQVFTFRFIDGYSWVRVASAIGNNTADSVRMICKRYIEGERGN